MAQGNVHLVLNAASFGSGGMVPSSIATGAITASSLTAQQLMLGLQRPVSVMLTELGQEHCREYFEAYLVFRPDSRPHMEWCGDKLFGRLGDVIAFLGDKVLSDPPLIYPHIILS